jgi:hypothetical protein
LQTSSSSSSLRVVRAAAADEGGAGKKGRDDQPQDWQVKYLYDGGCSVCNALVKLLKSKRGHEKIWYVSARVKKYHCPAGGWWRGRPCVLNPAALGAGFRAAAAHAWPAMGRASGWVSTALC